MSKKYTPGLEALRGVTLHSVTHMDVGAVGFKPGVSLQKVEVADRDMGYVEAITSAVRYSSDMLMQKVASAKQLAAAVDQMPVNKGIMNDNDMGKGPGGIPRPPSSRGRG